MKRIKRSYLASAAVLLATIGATASAEDYLSPALREAVERLKEEAAQTPSNNENGRARAHLLWEWANAFAMAGRFIPVNLTSSLNGAMNVPEGQRFRSGQLRSLDEYIYELRVRDENPNALGALSIAPEGPFEAESWQTIEVTYTVGELPIEAGGVVLVGRHFFSDSGQWQHTDPAADDYVSIRASDPSVRFEPSLVPVRGMHGGFRGPVEQVAFRLEEGALNEGDTLTVVYGDTSGGSRGHRMQTYSNDAAPLPIYVRFSPGTPFFSLPIPTFPVVGREAVAVHGFAPALVATGEAFDVRLRAEDVYRNRATGLIPELQVRLNGEQFRTVPQSRDGLQVLSNIVLSEPGTYRFSFASADGVIQGVSNPIWVEDEPGLRIYWGETHGHCGFAEGAGTPEGYFDFGRDDARLDFITLSEHDIWLDDYEWKRLNEVSERFTAEGEFLAFPGYEWTTPRQRGGHHNVFFNGFGFDRVPNQEAHYLSDLYYQLHAKHDPEDVLIIPHAHQAADWRRSDVRMERLVEIMSMHGTFEWFGNKYLQHGAEVGFVSASDDHLGHPGYTSGTGTSLKQHGGLAAVFSPALTMDDVFAALRARFAYATSGNRMLLSAELNGRRMGSRQPYMPDRELNGRVSGTAPIERVDLVKNGEVVATRQFVSNVINGTATVQVGFESSSEVLLTRDNPRGYRPWVGWLEVTGAHIEGVEAPGFHNARAEYARVDSETPNRVHFSTMTRGRQNSFLIHLEHATDDAAVRVHLERGRESGVAPTRIRPHADLPAADFTLRLADMAEGVVSEELPVDRYYRDRVSLRLVDLDAPLDQEFRFVDTTEPGYGDYYYVRVRQLNGALAWTSPFWVGGEPPQ